MDKGKTKKIQKAKMVQTQLSDREKSLLYLLAIMLVLIVGGKYIIIPTYEKMAELKVQSEEIQIKEVDVRASIESLEATKLETQRLMAQIGENPKNISTFLNDEGVDNLITKLCIENNLKHVALAIESAPYNKIDLEKIPGAPTAEGEIAAGDATAVETAAVEPAELIYTRSAEVNLMLKGSKQSMFGFIDNINSVPYLLVEGFASSFTSSTGDVPGEQTHSVKIKINMINTEFK